MPEMSLSRIAVALGLDAGADEAAILTAINREATPDPARFVPIEAVRELVAERAQQNAMASEEVTVARVETAMNAGYLTPAVRDWAVSLCRTDTASFDSFIAAATPVYAHLFQPSGRASFNVEGHRRPASVEEAAVFAQLGLDPDKAG